MKTTLKQIRAAGPCGLSLDDGGERTGYLKLKHYLGKGYGDDTPISLATVLDSNGLDDAHWCFQAVEGHDREIHLYGVWCVRDQCADFLTDERSTNALLVSERYANGLATDAELAAAWAAAWAAARAAARAATWGAADATDADADATVRAARATSAKAAAWATDETASEAAREAAWAAAMATNASEAAWAAASEAARGARVAQADELRRVCACIDAGEDPYPFKSEAGDPLRDEGRTVMTKLKVSEATGPVLDYMVAICQNVELDQFHRGVWFNSDDDRVIYEPSTNWEQGGPIVEREGILLRPVRCEGHELNGVWLAMYDDANTGAVVRWVKRTDWPRHYLAGPTPLVAAMRRYVQSKLGDEVEVPNELLD